MAITTTTWSVSKPGDVVEFVSEEIERLQHEIAEKYGYELLDHSLVLYVKNKDSRRRQLVLGAFSRAPASISAACSSVFA